MITNSLSQKTAEDFIYVFKTGQVAEQACCSDLEPSPSGDFRSTLNTRNATGGFVPRSDPEMLETLLRNEWAIDAILKATEKEKAEARAHHFLQISNKHQNSIHILLHGSAICGWKLDMIAVPTRRLPRHRPRRTRACAEAMLTDTHHTPHTCRALDG